MAKRTTATERTFDALVDELRALVGSMEDIFSATDRTDKAEALGVIEPFNSTRLHAFTSLARHFDNQVSKLKLGSSLFKTQSACVCRM